MSMSREADRWSGMKCNVAGRRETLSPSCVRSPGSTEKGVYNPPAESGKPRREGTFGVGSARVSKALADRRTRKGNLPADTNEDNKALRLPLSRPRTRYGYRSRSGSRHR